MTSAQSFRSSSDEQRRLKTLAALAGVIRAAQANGVTALWMDCWYLFGMSRVHRSVDPGVLV